MRQNFKAVPETDNLYPFSIQLNGRDKWVIFDLRVGGKIAQEFDTYASAETHVLTSGLLDGSQATPA